MEQRPRTRRAAAAVEALIEEYDLRSRIDEPDGATVAPGSYDLSWAHGRIEAARRAAEADVVTAAEALDWLAAEVGRELPDDSFDEDEGLPGDD